MPLAKPRVALSACTPRSCIAAGYPASNAGLLQSLTQALAGWTQVDTAAAGAAPCPPVSTKSLLPRRLLALAACL